MSCVSEVHTWVPMAFGNQVTGSHQFPNGKSGIGITEMMAPRNETYNLGLFKAIFIIKVILSATLKYGIGKME